MPTTSIKQLNIFGGEPTLIATGGTESGTRLNAPARHLARLLISPGHYMRYRKWEGGRDYMLYHGTQNPVRSFPPEVINRLKTCLKTDKHDRITFNLTRLRQQDGRTFLKRLYKTNVKPRTCN